LELFFRDLFLQAVIIRVCMLWKREIGAVNICVDVVVSHFVLGAVAANVVGDIGPGAKTVDLGALEQKQLLIGTPVGLEYRDRVLFDDLEGVGLRVVVLGAFPAGEARNAEVIFRTGGMGAGNSNLYRPPVSQFP
jgi:hypothetical protein